MLEDVYRDAAAVRRLQSCILGRHLEEFCAHLLERDWFTSLQTGWLTSPRAAQPAISGVAAASLTCTTRTPAWPWRGHFFSQMPQPMQSSNFT